MIQLAVEDGDLVLKGQSLKTVSGADRVYQDLSLAMVEPYGVDRFHPLWGSTLTNFIGAPQNKLIWLRIKSEVMRILHNYAEVQNALVTSEMSARIASRRSTVELIDEIRKVDIRPWRDRLYVTVDVVTAAGTPVTLNTVITR